MTQIILSSDGVTQLLPVKKIDVQVVQPVVHKETVSPTVIKETLSVYETVIEAPRIIQEEDIKIDKGVVQNPDEKQVV